VARTPFHVEVLTPEGKVFEDEVEMLSTRTGEGSIGILANHAPLLAFLEPTELRLHKEGDEIESFAQAEGYLQVIENEALVLVEECHRPDDLDRSDIESRLEDARNSLEQAEEGSEERDGYERDVQRYEAFLEVAEGQ
jgi:F-type H+-transporting ATPase subunit epsilon